MTVEEHMGSATFHADRPSDLRRSRPWHRLAYIVDALPAGIARMIPALEVPAEGRVLDFGCADRPYRHLFAPTTEFVGADLPGNPDAELVIGSDGTIETPPEAFDAVLSTQVLEHVADPDVYLAESHRVLRSGGRILLSTHGFMVYHPDPVDYWRWTSAGLRRAVESAGFEVERFEGIMGLSASGLQLVQDAVYWKFPRPLRPVLALVVQSLVRLADRLHSDESRRMNSLVFVLVARKP
jgi:SAM-dependent methyltransferase